MDDIKPFSFIRFYFAFEVENVNNLSRELQHCSYIFQVQTNVEWTVFILLGINKLGVKKFQVKIGLNNGISITMFKKLHFREVRLSHVCDRNRCVTDTKPEIHPVCDRCQCVRCSKKWRWSWRWTSLLIRGCRTTRALWRRETTDRPAAADSSCRDPSEVKISCGSLKVLNIRTVFRRGFIWSRLFPPEKSNNDSGQMLWTVGHVQRAFVDLLWYKQTAHIAHNCCISLPHYSSFSHWTSKSNPNAALLNSSLKV